MEISKTDLKKYIKTLEVLERLYNSFYDLKEYPKYLRRIIRKYIQKYYRKIYHNKTVKVRSTDYFVKKALKLYNSILNFTDESCNLDTLVWYDKVIYFTSKNVKRSFTYRFILDEVDSVFCVDCKMELKSIMIKYHLKVKSIRETSQPTN